MALSGGIPTIYQESVQQGSLPWIRHLWGASEQENRRGARNLSVVIQPLSQSQDISLGAAISVNSTSSVSPSTAATPDSSTAVSPVNASSTSTSASTWDRESINAIVRAEPDRARLIEIAQAALAIQVTAQASIPLRLQQTPPDSSAVALVSEAQIDSRIEDEESVSVNLNPPAIQAPPKRPSCMKLIVRFLKDQPRSKTSVTGDIREGVNQICEGNGWDRFENQTIRINLQRAKKKGAISGTRQRAARNGFSYSLP